MKFLLTSAGISNDSIRHALVDLLGKPIAESSALCIPTAAYACPGGAAMAWRLIRGVARSPLCELGWKSLGVLELTALPSIARRTVGSLWSRRPTPCWWTAAMPCICATGCGSRDWQTSCRSFLRETVYVGVSAGSMVVTPNIGEAYDGWFCREPPARICPQAPIERWDWLIFRCFRTWITQRCPDNSLANAEKWAAEDAGADVRD